MIEDIFNCFFISHPCRYWLQGVLAKQLKLRSFRNIFLFICNFIKVVII